MTDTPVQNPTEKSKRQTIILDIPDRPPADGSNVFHGCVMPRVVDLFSEAADKGMPVDYQSLKRAFVRDYGACYTGIHNGKIKLSADPKAFNGRHSGNSDTHITDSQAPKQIPVLIPQKSTNPTSATGTPGGPTAVKSGKTTNNPTRSPTGTPTSTTKKINTAATATADASMNTPTGTKNSKTSVAATISPRADKSKTANIPIGTGSTKSPARNPDRSSAKSTVGHSRISAPSADSSSAKRGTSRNTGKSTSPNPGAITSSAGRGIGRSTNNRANGRINSDVRGVTVRNTSGNSSPGGPKTGGGNDSTNAKSFSEPATLFGIYDFWNNFCLSSDINFPGNKLELF